MNAKVSIVEQIIEELMLHIETNGLEPGARMPTEKEVCGMMGVGRSTVREAYKVMQTRGIVRSVQGKGVFFSGSHLEAPFVSPFGDGEMRVWDYMDVRTAIETTSVKLAILRASQEQIASLEEIHRELEEAVGRGEVQRMADMDEAFHTAIARIAGNPLLIQVQDIVTKYFKSFRVHTFSDRVNRSHVLRPHAMIIQAFLDHNVDLGVLVMTQHLVQSYEDLKAFVPPAEQQQAAGAE